MTTSEEELARLCNEALKVAADGDVPSACNAIESRSDHHTIAQVYAKASQTAYLECKSVQTMAALSNAGIRYCLDSAEALANEDRESALKMKESAKNIAYNMAANSWPGWGDEGVVIGQADLAAGLQAAAVSLRLVQELELGSSQIGNAHWIIGALHLAAGSMDEAIAAFEMSRAAFLHAKEDDSVLLADGFIALTRKARPETREAGAEETAQVLETMKSKGTEDAAFFAGQIETADLILVSGKS